MRKTYIEPKMQEIRLNISNIICASNLGIDNDTTTGGAGIKEADSREGRFFDDDEDF